MSERSAMKRRVRGVLRRRWFGPLAATALALVPCAAAGALFALLVWPKISGSQVIDLSAMGLMGGSAMDTLVMIAATLGGGLVVNGKALASAGLAFLAPLAVFLFAALPMQVSLSGYFIALLRGKKPSPLEVLSCFGERYPRYLGGMLLRAAWMTLWIAAAYAFPCALYFEAQPLVPRVAQALKLINSWYVWMGLLGLCVAWMIVFTFVLINRALAYGFTAVCLAAHPRLPANRAPRLSRRIMRGCKWRVIGLDLSFLTWFLPAIASLLALGALYFAAPAVGFPPESARYVRLALLGVAAANQLAWVYVGPYRGACRRAFYIERKREALMDEDVNPDDFGKKIKPEKAEKRPAPAEGEKK